LARLACDFFAEPDLELMPPVDPLAVGVLRTPAGLPVSAPLPVLVVELDLPEDMPLLLPWVAPLPVPGAAFVPPAAAPVPPAITPPEPPLCAWAMPIAPTTASVAAIIRIACFMSRPWLVAIPRNREGWQFKGKGGAPSREKRAVVVQGVEPRSARAFAAIDRL